MCLPGYARWIGQTQLTNAHKGGRNGFAIGWGRWDGEELDRHGGLPQPDRAPTRGAPTEYRMGVGTAEVGAGLVPALVRAMYRADTVDRADPIDECLKSGRNGFAKIWGRGGQTRRSAAAGGNVWAGRERAPTRGAPTEIAMGEVVY